MAQHTVEIDYTIERGETAATALVNMTTGHDVTAEVKQVNGPAGGNPLAVVKGTPAALREFLDKHGYDVEDYGL